MTVGTGLEHKGINYDIGTNYEGSSLSRRTLSRSTIEYEIRVIRDELHCTSVAIYGTDIGRLGECSEVALDHGLDIWLQPRLIDGTPSQVLEHLAKAARVAERFRRHHARVTLNAGCELSVFASGIIPGCNYGQRASRLWYLWPLLPLFNWRLNRLLREGSVPNELVKDRTEGSFLARATERVGDTTVAEVEGRVAGSVMVVEDEVEQVYVARNHRGTGVSGVLLREAERSVRDGSYTSAWLAVVAGNARARRFYERSGWSDGGEFDYAASRASGKAGPILVPCHRYEEYVT